MFIHPHPPPSPSFPSPNPKVSFASIKSNYDASQSGKRLRLNTEACFSSGILTCCGGTPPKASLASQPRPGDWWKHSTGSQHRLRISPSGRGLGSWLGRWLKVEGHGGSAIPSSGSVLVASNLLIYRAPPPRAPSNTPTVSSLAAPPNWVKEAKAWWVWGRRLFKGGCSSPLSAS